MRCPRCQFKNPQGFNFCGNCGNTLTESPGKGSGLQLSDEKNVKLYDHFSRNIQKQILFQNRKMEGEYKQVTILFCDMKNFTSFVEGLGPEAAYDVMDQVYELLIQNVRYYGGTVNEMTGDGILALFGAPAAMEDAPLRAIRSSIKIHREIIRLNNTLKQGERNIPSIQMRAGINSGPVVVGSLGNELKAEFKVVGDAVNLASRLEGLARPGTTYVSEETFKLARGMFRFESLGEMKIKGKQRSESVFRLISSSNNRTRFDVSAEQGLTPLVGRTDELDILIDGFERMTSNQGQVFSVVSEAGIGKSRLLYEFRKAVSKTDPFFIEGRCLSYGKRISYHLIIDILKSNFNIQAGDNNKIIREKIVNGLIKINMDDKEVIPYFLEIFSIKDSGVKALLMSPDAMKSKISDALKQIIQNLSKIHPLVLTVEDLHWADERSIEIIEQLFESVPETRVFVILTFRPQFTPDWGTIPFHRQVRLRRLTTDQISIMVNHLLGPSIANQGFIDFIIDRTEGTPFFIEEFIKYLKENHLIEQRGGAYQINDNFYDMKIPVTIQDVIMARVDAVSERAKEILRIGSVVEREFSFELICGLVDHKAPELESILSVLKTSELIFERGVFPESIYVFKHALIREIIYESILSGKKKKYHEKIGRRLEKLVQDTLPEYYEILATHFICGANYQKGADYSRLSCRKLAKTVSPHDAIIYAKKRIECLEKLEKDDETEDQIIDARILLGLLYIQQNYHVPAMETIRPIVDAAKQKAGKRSLSQLYTIIGTYHYMILDDFSGAVDPFEKALKLSEAANDISSNLQAKYWLGLGQAFHCDFEAAEHNLNAVLEVNQAFNILWGISALHSVMSYFIYYYSGQIEKGYKASLEAVKNAEENNDIYTQSMAHVSHGVLCYGKGVFEKAIEHLEKGSKLCGRMDFFTWQGMAHLCLGELYYETCQYEKSLYYFNKVSLIPEKGEVGPSWHNIGSMGAILAETKIGDGRIDHGALITLMDQIRLVSFKGCKLRFLSQIFFNIKGPYLCQAEEMIQKAIKADTFHGMDFSLGKNYQLYARQLKDSNDATKSVVYYKKAIDLFQKCKAGNWIENSKKEMALIRKLENASNEPTI